LFTFLTTVLLNYHTNKRIFSTKWFCWLF